MTKSFDDKLRKYTRLNSETPEQWIKRNPLIFIEISAMPKQVLKQHLLRGLLEYDRLKALFDIVMSQKQTTDQLSADREKNIQRLWRSHEKNVHIVSKNREQRIRASESARANRDKSHYHEALKLFDSLSPEFKLNKSAAAREIKRKAKGKVADLSERQIINICYSVKKVGNRRR